MEPSAGRAVISAEEAQRVFAITLFTDDLAESARFYRTVFDVPVVHEDATVVLSRDGWMKRVREVKDPTSTRLREGDALFALLPGSTRDRLVLFSSKGTVYVMRVADVPATTGYGEPVQSLLKFGDGERVVVARLIREPDKSAPAGNEAPAQAALPGIRP